MEWKDIAPKTGKNDVRADMQALFENWTENGVGYQQVYEGVLEALQDHLMDCVDERFGASIRPFVQAMDWISFYADACAKSITQARAEQIKEIMN